MLIKVLNMILQRVTKTRHLLQKASSITNYQVILLQSVKVIDVFHATDLFLYFLRTSENKRFSDIFREFRKRPVA